MFVLGHIFTLSQVFGSLTSAVSLGFARMWQVSELFTQLHSINWSFWVEMGGKKFGQERWVLEVNLYIQIVSHSYLVKFF